MKKAICTVVLTLMLFLTLNIVEECSYLGPCPTTETNW